MSVGSVERGFGESSSETTHGMIYARVKGELQAAHVDSDILMTMTLDRLFPPLEVSDRQLTILQRFDAKPITVWDQELSKILRLKPSTAKSLPSSGSRCYFRSWQLAKVVLQEIIQSIRLEALDFGRLEVWEIQMADLNDSDQVFIRYVGQTTATTSWSRFKSATKVNPTAPISVFSAEIDKIDCSYIQLRIYELCDTITETFPMPKGSTRAFTEDIHEELIDGYERAAIAFFGPCSLLNKTSGGRWARFVPGMFELRILNSINSNVVHNIAQQKRANLSPQTPALAAMSTDIQAWVAKSTLLLGLDNDRLRKVKTHISTHYASQATCQRISGHCVHSIIGASVSDTSLEENTGFFTGRSHTSRSVVNAMQTLADFESSFTAGNIKSLLDITSFTNLYNWPHKRYGQDKPMAVEILQNYLRLLQPLIVSSLGKTTFDAFQISRAVTSVNALAWRSLS